MILNVLYSCNENYVKQAGISIISLCENNKLFDDIHIFFVEDKITRASKQQLMQIVDKYNRSITFFAQENILDRNLFLKADGNHPLTIYSKLFCNKLPVTDKILYLDCDCIVVKPLYELWKLDMGDMAIAGVSMPYSENYKGLTNLGNCEKYICDGVVLFNLSVWRKYNLEKRSLEYIEKWNGNPPMLSEGTLNNVCQAHILLLPPCYNLMSHMLVLQKDKLKQFYKCTSYYKIYELEDAVKNPVIIHYLREFYERPWFSDSDHPLKDVYLFYKEKSPWKFDNQSKGSFSEKYKIKRKLLAYLPKLLVGIIGFFRDMSFKRKQSSRQ